MDVGRVGGVWSVEGVQGYSVNHPSLIVPHTEPATPWTGRSSLSPKENKGINFQSIRKRLFFFLTELWIISLSNAPLFKFLTTRKVQRRCSSFNVRVQGDKNRMWKDKKRLVSRTHSPWCNQNHTIFRSVRPNLPYCNPMALFHAVFLGYMWTESSQNILQRMKLMMDSEQP